MLKNVHENKPSMGDLLTPEMERCAVDCLNAHSICLRSIRYCLTQGGKHAEPGHISLLMDCAEICQTTENFILNGNTQLFERIASICADVCDVCARSMDHFGDDVQMTACAVACRKCASSARALISGARGQTKAA